MYQIKQFSRIPKLETIITRIRKCKVSKEELVVYIVGKNGYNHHVSYNRKSCKEMQLRLFGDKGKKKAVEGRAVQAFYIDDKLVHVEPSEPSWTVIPNKKRKPNDPIRLTHYVQEWRLKRGLPPIDIDEIDPKPF